MEKPKKIGIMGGTFDPVHIGHLILGEYAYQQFELDKVLFMPSGNPPHKKEREGRASTAQRIEMVRLAVQSNPHFELSLAEAHDQGYTYTKETLLRLSRENPDIHYYFIMGADSLNAFESWKNPEDICRLCTLVVAVRDHVNPEKLDQQITYLKNKFDACIEKLDTPNIDISSGTIREWIHLHKPIKYYVLDEVDDFIRKNQIYREGLEAHE